MLIHCNWKRVFFRVFCSDAPVQIRLVHAPFTATNSHQYKSKHTTTKKYISSMMTHHRLLLAVCCAAQPSTTQLSTSMHVSFLLQPLVLTIKCIHRSLLYEAMEHASYVFTSSVICKLCYWIRLLHDSSVFIHICFFSHVAGKIVKNSQVQNLTIHKATRLNTLQMFLPITKSLVTFIPI